MKRIIYYQALLPVESYQYLVYQWFEGSADLDKVQEFLTNIQINHMKNRLSERYYLYIPFFINYKLGGIKELDYSI